MRHRSHKLIAAAQQQTPACWLISWQLVATMLRRPRRFEAELWWLLLAIPSRRPPDRRDERPSNLKHLSLSVKQITAPRPCLASSATEWREHVAPDASPGIDWQVEGKPRRGGSSPRFAAAPPGLRAASTSSLGLTPQATCWRPSGTEDAGHVLLRRRPHHVLSTFCSSFRTRLWIQRGHYTD